MAAVALLRSVASKMLSRAAPMHHHHRSVVARGLHGGARSRPATDAIQQGTADVPGPPGLRSIAGIHHRLVHGRGIHSRTSPDPIPSSTPPKVLDTIGAALDMASNVAIGVGFIAVFGSMVCMHFWVNPKREELKAMFQDLRHGNKTRKGTRVIDKLGKEAAAKTMHSQENRVKELEATIVDLKAENAELKMALDSARSQGKV